jgi:hypothetical protein
VKVAESSVVSNMEAEFLLVNVDVKYAAREACFNYSGARSSVIHH